jgi:hypothetical protein
VNQESRPSAVAIASKIRPGSARTIVEKLTSRFIAIITLQSSVVSWSNHPDYVPNSGVFLLWMRVRIQSSGCRIGPDVKLQFHLHAPVGQCGARC